MSSRSVDLGATFPVAATGGGGGTVIVNQGAFIHVPNQTAAIPMTFAASDAVFDQNTFVGTNQLTAKRTGIHLLVCQSTCTANGPALIYYRVNSAGYTVFTIIVDGQTNTGTILLALNAGDVVQLAANTAASTTLAEIYVSFSEIGVN